MYETLVSITCKATEVIHNTKEATGIKGTKRTSPGAGGALLASGADYSYSATQIEGK